MHRHTDAIQLSRATTDKSVGDAARLQPLEAVFHNLQEK